MTTSGQTNVEPQSSGLSTKKPTASSALTAKRKTRESTPEKALRLLTQGRLRVTKVDGDLVKAECRGDSGRVYELGHNNGQWICSCPARTSCSHMMALWLVTVAG